MTVDILTASIRPEMEGLCRFLADRQTADVKHFFALDVSAATSRNSVLARLVAACKTEFFVLMDDDDYIDPGFVGRLFDRIAGGLSPIEDCLGEIPQRTYHIAGAWGEGATRQKLFSTFTLFRTAPMRQTVLRALNGGGFSSWIGGGPHSDHLIIMRGLMADPSTARTPQKNTDPGIFPNQDPDHAKLREWLADDPEALERYLEFAP